MIQTLGPPFKHSSTARHDMPLTCGPRRYARRRRGADIDYDLEDTADSAAPRSGRAGSNSRVGQLPAEALTPSRTAAPATPIELQLHVSIPRVSTSEKTPAWSPTRYAPIEVSPGETLTASSDTSTLTDRSYSSTEDESSSLTTTESDASTVMLSARLPPSPFCFSQQLYKVGSPGRIRALYGRSCPVL